MHNQIIEDTNEILDKLEFDWFAEKEVLVTGASGMIGIYLISCLAEMQNRKVGPSKIYAVSQSGDYPINLDIFKNNQIEFLRKNLSDFDQTSKLPVVDAVIHAAGYAQPSVFLSNPISTLMLNSMATMQLIQKTRPNGKFLFISSSELYSGLTKTPFVENMIGTTSPDHPRAVYIEGKRTGECLVNIARSENKIHATNVRLSLAYGPGTKKNDTRVLNNLISKAIIENKIELLDSGKSIRTYCYVSDAVELILAAMIHGTSAVYNIGGQSRISIRELAEEISVITKSSFHVPEIENGLKGAPLDVQLNLDLILQKHHKNSFIGITEGLKRTIDWQKSNIFEKKEG